MSKLVIFALLIVAISAQVTPEQIGKCIATNCTSYINTCVAQPLCNSTRACLENCGHWNQECDFKCFEAVYNDTDFWAIDLCATDCTAFWAYEDGCNVTACGVRQGDFCYYQFQQCQADTGCMAGVSCLEQCPKNQNTTIPCEAQCVVNSNTNFNFMQLYHCQEKCLQFFITAPNPNEDSQVESA